MSSKLYETVTKDLMEKFGQGSHKPGSGSAAALDGMIAAKLLITVIDITDKTKVRYNYGVHLERLFRFREDIDKRIYPALVQLFQEDSDYFDKVISVRRERNAARNKQDWAVFRAKTIEVDAALRIATDLPLRIAELCYDLGKYACDVFNHGFQDARGDSGVALHNAIAVMGGCLSIINLNLSQLPSDGWTTDFQEKIPLIKRQFMELSALGLAKIEFLEQETKEKWEIQHTFEKYRQGNLGDTILKDQDMEDLVRHLHLKLWEKRDIIWKEDPTDNAMDMIDPEAVIRKVLGYSFADTDSLGIHAIGNDLVEIAGMIDKDRQWIGISPNFPDEVKRFTMAHELGHAILHKQAVQHRDRPFDGSILIPKDAFEKQADKFAAYFLMPGKQVSKVFQFIFGAPKLYINESSVLALGMGNIHALRAKCKDRRGFADVIAKTELYGGKPINSLAKIFGVSAGAMAVRLIELDLVIY